MSNKIKIDESSLNKIIKESINKVINEAESGGWVVNTEDAREAYEFAVQELGEETINSAIVRCLGDVQLSECLAYIFRQYEFTPWAERMEQ